MKAERIPDRTDTEEKSRLLQRQLRRMGIQKREELPGPLRLQKDGQIAERLFLLPWYREAKSLLIYVSFRSEVDTIAILKRALADGKRVFCPRVQETEMAFWRIRSLTDLKPGFRGIREPAVPKQDSMGKTEGEGAFCPQTDGPALAVVPGCVFDRHGHRIGYGGGYYDRYFGGMEKERRPRLAGLCYACQLTEQIVPLSHDVDMDVVLTEEGSYGWI